MALKQDITFRSIPVTDAYRKIVTVETFDTTVVDEETEQESKVYNSSVWIADYPSSDKEEELERNPHMVEITDPDEIKIIKAYLTLHYSKLKELGAFETAIDC